VPFHSVLYEILDPIRILFRSAAETDPETGLPPSVQQPRVSWFDTNQRAETDPKSDWLVDVYDSRFVGVRYQVDDAPAIFGDLREERTSFVAWRPLHPRRQFARCAIAELGRERLPSPKRWVDFVADWEDPTKWPKELADLGYRFERHADGDPLRLAAEVSARSPVTSTTINISLAMRKALRRYLNLEPAVTAATSGGRHERPGE
jgi:hypothetical protein